jgi:hypothetical protein
MFVRRAWSFIAALTLALSFLALSPATARALSTCVFITTGTSMVLQNSCTTDTTITVLPGITLDGNGYTITAVEPLSGHFTGAVVQNAMAGGEIHVTNLTIVASLNGNPCDAGEQRLRGILFFGASGTATNNHVTVTQGVNFGCQEGNAIEARNFVDETLFSPDRTTVTISDNVVPQYQKTGILANGNVDAIITRNVITGVGATTLIAQNGVQIGFGATGLVSANEISGSNYTPNSFFACGIIVVDSDGVDRKQQDNLFPPQGDPMANEKDTCGFAKGGNYEPFGR